MNTTYKNAVVTKFGGPEVIKIVEKERTAPPEGFVGISIEASGVSPVDILMREGVYWGVPKPPFTLGYDLVGRVVSLGAGVSKWKIGDRVAAMPMLGGNSQYINLHEDELVSVPETLDIAQAVCMVFNYLTAYQILHRIANIKPGEKVLIHGAAGGVGSALVELCQLMKLEVYGSASSSKQEFVRKLGAIPIDYTKENFVSKIFQLTKTGVDVVVDGVGGQHLVDSYRVLRKGGRLVAYGFSSMLSSGRVDLFRLVKFYVGSIRGIVLSILPFGKKLYFYRSKILQKQHLDWFQQDVTQLFKWLEEKRLNPVIAAKFPLEQVQKTHEMIGANIVQGKIVLVLNQQSQF